MKISKTEIIICILFIGVILGLCALSPNKDPEVGMPPAANFEPKYGQLYMKISPASEDPGKERQQAFHAMNVREAKVEKDMLLAAARRNATIHPSRGQRRSTITGSCGPSTNPYVQPCGCEASHPQAWSPSGKYYGKYQYGKTDWAANGGDPAKYGNATEAEQDAVAANTHYDAWPNC